MSSSPHIEIGSTTKEQSSRDQSPTSPRPCRVLLIEDNANDVVLIKRALSKARIRFDVVCASDLATGLAAAGATFDAALTDLTLPDASGPEAVKQLRLRVPDLPIIVLTGLASDEAALESLDCGAQDYLVKDTISPEILEHAIRYAVQRQKNVAMRRILGRLQASERALEKKNRRLARLYKTAHRFVDNVSHEFRTPLTVVNEYVSLLRDGLVGPLNDEQNRMLDVVADRAEDLNNMVDDMLDVSKLEAGMLGLWRRSCGIDAIVDHIRPSLLRKSIVKQVELQFDIPDDLPEVFCDDEKVGRVLINLTVNAIKFCGQPGLVQVWAKFDEKAREVTVGVTDNGEGIEPDNLALIFQRFKQVQAHPRGSSKGFGLGLNIAKELVHLNLGEIHVKSTPGKGSTFWFSLPIADPREVMSRHLKWIAQFQSGPSAVSLVRASFDAAGRGESAEDVNTFLNMLLRRHDLVVRIENAVWILAVPCEEPELKSLFARAEKTRHTVNRNRVGDPVPPIDMLILGTWLMPGGVSTALDAFAREVSGAESHAEDRHVAV